jgi:hypothetical protein
MGFINPMLHHTDEEWAGEPLEPYEYHSRSKSVALWISVAVLAAVLGALIYYGYRIVKTQDIRITQVFGRDGTLNTLGQRADAAESKIRDLAGDWQGMGNRITKLEARVGLELKETRHYAETLTQQLHQQIISEMDARTATLDARLRQIESVQAEQRTQMARVEANFKQDISASQEESGRELSSVRQQEEINARGVTAVSQRLERQRIDFELAKGKSKELMPGISLQIRGVNQSHQRYHGLLSLTRDQRTIWLRDQSVQEPVRFFRAEGGEPYEMVVTDVTKKTVAGYLLVPVKGDGASSASADSVRPGIEANRSTSEN